MGQMGTAYNILFQVHKEFYCFQIPDKLLTMLLQVSKKHTAINLLQIS